MSLQDQIDQRAKEIHTDAYPMSIGELMNLYRDGELDLQPEFQRFFRWTRLQKSKLIESLLLGIPIPSLFVAQRENGVWDVVDGLQRLSTIFEFAGMLRAEDGALLPASALEGTDYLPGLAGKVWDDEIVSQSPGEGEIGGREALTQVQRLALKRTKLSLNIIKRESAGDTKLELFHRLNSLGTRLSDQEQRNCLLLLKNREAFVWATDLSADANFASVVNMSDALLEQRYDVELVWRFMSIRHADATEYAKITDIAEFLTRHSLAIADSADCPREKEAEVFTATFRILAETIGEDAFRKYEKNDKRFVRSFLISAFEAVALGVAANLDAIDGLKPKNKEDFVVKQVQRLWSEAEFVSNMGSGKTPARRLSHLIPFGAQHFRP